ncbi:MAG: 6-phosphogluconolactonase [Clostridia bacterium]|nr:6-phosphogluconolactonase [Clostridia bacterium]
MEFKKDELVVKFLENRDLMGKVAADEAAAVIVKLLEEKDELNIVFAAAPSQNDLLAHLLEHKEIEWNKINAFNMDEYFGLGSDAPQCFSNYLKDHIFTKAPFKSVNLLNPDAESAEIECERFTKLISANPIDIVFMGIGENGHIAFNDPDVADFNDSKVVKPVEIDDICRMQQVNDGCFAKIDEVPHLAMTLTIPTLVSAKYNFCVVPCATKANAVAETLLGEIGEKCPATSLRLKDNAFLYCDAESSALYRSKVGE